MGMYATLRRASAADVARLRADPAAVDAFLHGEQPPATPDGGGLFGFLRRLLPVTATSAAPPTPAEPREPTWPEPAEGDAVHLDKAWHGVHYLLTRSADERPLPAGFVLSGGEEIGDDDSTTRLLDPEQVRAIADFLATLDADELTRRFDPTRMTELRIYPDVIWVRESGDDAHGDAADAHTPLRWLLDAVEELRTFTRLAADAGDAVVVDVS